MNTFKCILKPVVHVEEEAFYVNAKDIKHRKRMIEDAGMQVGDIIVMSHCGYMTPAEFYEKYNKTSC